MAETLKTGDIILFNDEPKCGSILVVLDWAIRWWTGSPYSHAGLVVVNPPWPGRKKGEIEPWSCRKKDEIEYKKGEKNYLEGTYIWDSSYHNHKDPQDGRIKFGIALVPIGQYINDANEKHQKLYKRSPKSPETYKSCWTPEKIQKIHCKVYGKPYDKNLSDWWAGMWHILIPRTVDRFWCSAFVAYALREVGVLKQDTNWTVVSPADLSSKTTNPYMRGRWEHAYSKDELFSEF